MAKKPLPLAEVRRRLRDPKLKIVMAPKDAVEDLKPYVDRILVVVKDVFGIRNAWISDESCLSDFFDGNRDRTQDQRLFDQIGALLGLRLDRTNDDDNYIVKIARKLKQRTELLS
jgi:hypothetical protein